MTKYEEWGHLYVKEGWSLQRIGAIYKVTPKTVKRGLVKLGVTLRKPGRYGSLVGAEKAGTYKAVSQATGIPASTLHYRRKRLTSKDAADSPPDPDGDACRPA